MTLSSTTTRSTGTGDASTVIFPYGFKIFTESEILVYVAGVLQTITTHYTVSGVGETNGGNVTFEAGSTPANSAAIVMARSAAKTQTTDYTIAGAVSPPTVEDALDKLTMIAQDINLSDTDSFGFATTVTDAGTTKVSLASADRASKVLAFDSSGDLTANQELGEHQGNWATATAYSLRDIIKDTSNDNVYICITAHTSTGSQPISSNADVAKWTLIFDAAATAADAVSTAADVVSTNADVVSTNADLVSTNADVVLTNADAASCAAYATSLAATSVYFATTGSSSAYVLTPTTALTSYIEGVTYLIKANHGSTGASTLNVSGLGAKTITKPNGSAIATGDIAVDGIYFATYDGTNFQLIGGIGGTSSQVTLNTIAIFLNTIEDMADSSEANRAIIDGFTDDFQDGTTQANTAIDISDNTGNGITHDNTNKLWKNTPAGTYNSDKDYTTESNYLQQEWNASKGGTSNATFTLSSANVTISSGTFPTNCDAGRISADGGTTWYDILSGEGTTTLVLTSNFAESTTTVDYILRFSKITGGLAQLHEGVAAAGIDSTTIFMLKDEDTDETTTFSDLGPLGLTVAREYSAVKIDTAQFKFGASSLNGPSGSDRVLITPAASEFQFGTSLAFTVEMFIRFDTAVANAVFFSLDDGGGSSYFLFRYTHSGTTLRLEDSHIGLIKSETWTPSADTWYHIAVTRDTSNNLNLFANGNRLGTATNGSYDVNALGVRVEPAIGYVNGSNFLVGWQDNIRISNDVKYSGSTYTVPTAAFSGITVPTSEYISVCDTEATKTDTSDITDINSGAVTETLNSQTISYWVSFDPVALFAAGTEISIFNQTGSVWRVIAVNTAGTWQYNNNASHDATQTLVNSTVNDMLHAISQAVSSQAANRMTGAELAAITTSEWVTTNGWSTSIDAIIRGATFYTSSTSSNPTLSQYRINYDAPTANALITNQDFGSTGMPIAPTADIDTLVLMVIDKQVSGTPTYEVSANGGTNWTTVSSWDEESTIANSYIARLAEVTVSAHTSPRQLPRFRIRNGSTGESYEHKAVGLQYK